MQATQAKEPAQSLPAPGGGDGGYGGGGGGDAGAFGTDGGDLAGAAAPKKAASPEEIAASVYVVGVSPAVNDQTLREFLECCGPLKTLTLTPTGLPPEHGRQYTAVYADATAAQSALVLNNMTLVDRAITVVSAEQAMKNALGGGAGAPGMGYAMGPGGYAMDGVGMMPALTPEQQQAQWQQQQEFTIQQQQVVMAQQAVMEDPMMLWKRAAEKLPTWLPKGFKRCALFIPIPHLINCARASAEAHIDFAGELRRDKERGLPMDLSDVSRTVYAGNVNSSITEDMLADFFSIAGNVTYVKFAGSDFNPSRFGFVEFDCKAAAEAAKALSGTMLAEMTVKVKHSNNPIIKDKLKNIWGTLATNRRRSRKKVKKDREKRDKKNNKREASPSSSSSSSSSTASEERRRRRRRKEERKKKKDEDKGKGRDKDEAKVEAGAEAEAEAEAGAEAGTAEGDGLKESGDAGGGGGNEVKEEKGGGDGEKRKRETESDGEEGRKSSRGGGRESSRRSRSKRDKGDGDGDGDAKGEGGGDGEKKGAVAADTECGNGEDVNKGEEVKDEQAGGDGDDGADRKRGRGGRDSKDGGGSRMSRRTRSGAKDEDGGDAEKMVKTNSKE
jgi:hypothetical protein